jgi:ribosomal protein S12 methylthiotransferase accessory factor
MDMKITFPGGKKVNAEYKGFIIKTDQSKHAGGEESAPEPFSYFLSSIGTCAGLYALSFCQQRDIPTENLVLTMKMQKNKNTGLIERIDIEIQVPGTFPDQYKNALIRSASLCTVKKNLENPPSINIYVAKG